MAKDLLKVLNEIRGTGEPEAVYTDGIYYDITGKTTEANNVTPRLAPGIYGSIQVMYNGVAQVLAISDAITALNSITTVLSSLYTDKIKLDSIYADKITLDSLYADKLTLDSIYADKVKLDSLYLDKAKLDSLYADKITLDSLFADKATLDSLVADKVKLDSIYADKAKLDSLYADKTTFDGIYAALTSINTVSTNIGSVNTVSGAIANVSTVATNIADLNAIVTSVIPNLAEILLADDNAALVSNLYDQFDDRYLGSKSVEPAVDNDGNVLLVGALYFDSVLNKMREWTGTQWQDSLTLTAGSISSLTNKIIDSITNTVGADHVHYKVRNASGSIIPVGTVVAAMGTQPGTDYIQVVPVTDPQTQIAIGIVHTELGNNGTGLCVSRGIHDNANTSAWVVGTILYPNTSGGFTTVKPTAGMYQACAYVMRQHSSSGTLLVNFIEPKTIASTTLAGEVVLDNTLTNTSITKALTAAQGKVLQDGKQPIDATLTALAGVTTAADKLIYATDVDTFTTSTLTAFGRSLVDDIDATTARTTLGVTIGTNVQAYDANLTTWASITPSTKANTADVLPLTGGTMTGAITALRETKVAMGANDIALASGNVFTKTISGATTLTVSGWLASGNANSFILELTNGGAFAVTYFTGVKWAGGIAPTLTAAGVDILGFYSHDGGTTVRGILLSKDSK